jgi:hypothetical protein
MEKCWDTEEDGDINDAWKKFAEQIETKARMVQEKTQKKETQRGKGNVGNRGGGIGKPFASKDTRTRMRARRWMKLAIRKGTQELQDNSKPDMSEEMLREAEMVFNVNYRHSQKQMLTDWKEQYDKQRRRDNAEMVRLRQEEMEKRIQKRDEKLKNPREKGAVIRSIMKERREATMLKSVWVVREGEEIHVNDEEGVKEEVKAFFQELFNTRGRDPREEGHTHEQSVALMPAHIRKGYEYQKPHLWKKAYGDDGSRPFSGEELGKYMRKTANGKTGGHTGMTRELLKWLGEDGMEEFRTLLNKIWETQEVPEEWTKGVLHPLEKVKGKVGLDNIRPITLLEVALKTITGLLSDRILKAWQREDILHNQQYGFRKHTSMTDAIMLYRLLQEYDQYNEDLGIQQAGHKNQFHAVMMDLRKAYDSCEFWATEMGCRSLGIPERIIKFFSNTENRMTTQVRTAYGLTDPIKIRRGMMQGDSASPARFLAFINPMLVIVNEQCRGITSPKGENLAAVSAVDDTILYGRTEEDIQNTADVFSEWLEYVKMEANVKKCIYIRSRADKNHVARRTADRMGKRDKCSEQDMQEEITVQKMLKRMGLEAGEKEVRLHYMRACVRNVRSEKEEEQMLREAEMKGKDTTWYMEEGDEKLTEEQIENTCKIFKISHVHILDTLEEIRVTQTDEQGNDVEVTSPEKTMSEDTIFTTSVDGKILITERWVPKVGPWGGKQKVTRLKQGEHTRYLGAWLTDKVSDGNQVQRLDKLIKNVVKHINNASASYAVCKYIVQTKIGGSANYVMRFTNIRDSQLKEWDHMIHTALIRKAVPPNAWALKGTQMIQAEEWGPDATSLEAMYKAMQIENTLDLMNTDTIQAQLFKDILDKYSRTRGYENQCLHRPQQRKGNTLSRIHSSTIMVATENALATLNWKIQMPGEGKEESSAQIADYLTDSERNEYWPVMWRHRIWRTEQWKQEDGRQRHHNLLANKAEREQRREIIRKAKELQEWEGDETEEEQWEEEVKQLLREAEGLPGQRLERMRCKKCGRDRIVMNQQNIERECKEIGRDCAELPDIGIRGERIYKENRKITHAEREKLSGHIESWRRELIRCMDEDVLKLYKIYQKSKEEHEETKEKKMGRKQI